MIWLTGWTKVSQWSVKGRSNLGQGQGHSLSSARSTIEPTCWSNLTFDQHENTWPTCSSVMNCNCNANIESVVLVTMRVHDISNLSLCPWYSIKRMPTVEGTIQSKKFLRLCLCKVSNQSILCLCYMRKPKSTRTSCILLISLITYFGTALKWIFIWALLIPYDY